jgi:carbonic anhydrase
MVRPKDWSRELLDANADYVKSFSLGGIDPKADRHVAVVTCMDTRIEPLGMLGLKPGDAKIMRNAGGRVTDDVLRSLVLAVHMLDVDRVVVVHHTQCALMNTTDDELRAAVGPGSETWVFEAMPDPDAALDADVQRVRDCPLLPASVAVEGFLYDVADGRLSPA